jgi:hypothetical protein
MSMTVTGTCLLRWIVHDRAFQLLDRREEVQALKKVAIAVRPGAVRGVPLPLEQIWNARFAPATSGLIDAQFAPAASVLELLRNSLSVTTDLELELARPAHLVGQVPSTKNGYAHVEAAAMSVHAATASHRAKF